MLEKTNNKKTIIAILAIVIALAIIAGAVFWAIKHGYVNTYRISSDNGFAQNDITLLQDLDDVYEVYGVFAFLTNDQTVSVRSLESAQGHDLLQGAFPANSSEIALDSTFAANNSISVGNQIKLADSDFNVVGLFEAETAGYNALAYKAAFGEKQYDELIVGIIGDTPLEEVIEPIKQKLVNNRIQEIYKEKNKEILAKEDEYNYLDEAAKIALEEVEKMLDGADSELKAKYAELEDYIKQMDEAKAELDSSEKLLKSYQTQLDSAKKELNSAKNELQSAEDEYNSGRSEAKSLLNITDDELDQYLEQLKQYTDSNGNLDVSQAKSYYANLQVNGQDLATVATQQATALDEIDSLKTQLAEHQATHTESTSYCRTCTNLQSQITQKTNSADQTYQSIEQLSQYISYLYPDYKLENTSESMTELAELISETDLDQLTDETADKIEAMMKAKDEIPAAKEELAKNESDYNDALKEFNASKTKFASAEKEYKDHEKELQAALDEWNENNDLYNNKKDEFNNQKEEVNDELQKLYDEKDAIEADKEGVSINWNISGVISSADSNHALLKTLLIAFGIVDIVLVVLFVYMKKYGQA